MTPTLILGVGFLVGLGHAFEADHVSAVSTQIVKQKTLAKNSIKSCFAKSSILGAIWGAGHTTSLVLFGFATYLLTITLTPEIFLGFEFLVGAMLVFLGLSTVINKKIRFKHTHPHKHSDGKIHFDAHNHGEEDHTHNHKSYVIGLIHGLAGSGTLVVLTAGTFDSIETTLAFVGVFGLGSAIGMMLISGVLGLPLIFSHKISNFKKILRYAAGGFSIILGVNILVEVGFAQMLESWL